VTASPSVAEGAVYFPSGYNVYALNAKTGDELWVAPPMQL
jgi:outer membrane protein assembly factor BamB